jgi:hypothetical protein
MTQTGMVGDIESLYSDIRQELIRLHANWQMFRQLFTVSDEQMELLNNTAPGFFHLLQDVLVDNAVIILSRLTDSNKYNSLPRLVKLLKNHVVHSFYEELKSDIEIIETSCADIREHRNRRVAHNERLDQRPEYDIDAERLPILTRDKIEGTMVEMAMFMNKIIGYFESTEQFYEPIVRGDAESLVFFIEKGYEATRHPKEYR